MDQCITAEKTIILMETLLIIIQEIQQKPAVLFNIHNYQYSMDTELIRIDTWLIDMVSGNKKPVKMNQDIVADYQLWQNSNFILVLLAERKKKGRQQKDTY